MDRLRCPLRLLPGDDTPGQTGRGVQVSHWRHHVMGDGPRPATPPRTLTLDGWLLFATRFARLFAYGLLSVVLVLYLTAVGLSEGEVGLLLTLTLLGDVGISL